MAPVTVELCGRLADRAGDHVSIAIALPASIAAIRAAIAIAYPALAADLASDRVRTCVDELIVADDAIVTAGQALALFPPVSGG